MKSPFASALLIATVSVGVAAPTQAQTPPQKTPAPKRVPSLDMIRHNPKTQGVLLFVGNRYEMNDMIASPEEVVAPKRTAATFATGGGRRLAIYGNASAIVSLTMAEIAKNPPPADPFADMSFDDRFTLLLGQLTRPQWAQAASDTGIGLGDLTPPQREIYAGLWGTGATVSTLSYGVPEPVQGGRPVRFVKEETFGATAVRFRLSRRVGFLFEDVAKKQRYMSGPISYREPDEPGEPNADGVSFKEEFRIPRKNSQPNTDVVAYGVTVMRYVPNTLKRGDLSLNAPALGVPVTLSGQKTVGELLADVSKATRFELRADKRLADLPVLMKTVEGGQSVSADDLLKLLCRSVTGTFRHLPGATADPGVYLLTDDVEGLGTRIARLDRWAKDASAKRSKLIQEALDACSETEPLDALGFVKNDRYALPADMLKAENEARRKSGVYWNGTPISPAKLTPELREKMTQEMKTYNWDNAPTFRTDEVTVKTEFHCDWVLPDNRTFPARIDGQLQYGFLDRIATPRSQRTKSVERPKREHSEPSGFPANLKRRILVAPLPDSDAATVVLIKAARAKGFNEIWLRVEDEGDTEHARLKSAVATGKTLQVPVGAVLPWILKKPEDNAAKVVEDVNILGETGAQVWARSQSNTPPSVKNNTPPTKDDAVAREYFAAVRRKSAALTAGWIVPDAALAARRIAPFLAVPGLSAVVLTQTAAPGYDGASYNYSPDIGTMGYAPALRLACVRGAGVDPVDLQQQSYSLDVSLAPPFFTVPYSVQPVVAAFRSAQNKAFLADVWRNLRPGTATPPLYLDDRKAGYSSQNPFYARWSDPVRVPTVPEYGHEEGVIRAAAFKASDEPLLGTQGTPFPALADYFWSQWYDSTRAAARWRGFVSDLSYQSPEQIADFLKILPDDAAPNISATVKPAPVPKKL